MLVSPATMTGRSHQEGPPEIGTDSPEARALARLAIDYYRYALDGRRSIPEDHFITVRYDDLALRPADTVESIYERLGLEMSPSFRERLDEAVVGHRAFASQHSYSLQEFGLSEEEIYQELHDIFEEFGFEPPAGFGETSSPLSDRGCLA